MTPRTELLGSLSTETLGLRCAMGPARTPPAPRGSACDLACLAGMARRSLCPWPWRCCCTGTSWPTPSGPQPVLAPVPGHCTRARVTWVLLVLLSAWWVGGLSDARIGFHCTCGGTQTKMPSLAKLAVWPHPLSSTTPGVCGRSRLLCRGIGGSALAVATLAWCAAARARLRVVSWCCLGPPPRSRSPDDAADAHDLPLADSDARDRWGFLAAGPASVCRCSPSRWGSWPSAWSRYDGSRVRHAVTIWLDAVATADAPMSHYNSRLGLARLW